MATYNIPVTDYSNEKSRISMHVIIGEIDGNLTYMFDEFGNITLGTFGLATYNTSTPKNAGPGGPATSKLAHRKLKWLCRYHDTTTLEKLTLEIPCPDLALLAANSDFANVTSGAGLTLKTAWDAHVKNRRNGNATILDSLQVVGRRLN